MGLGLRPNGKTTTISKARQNLFVSPDTDYTLTGKYLCGNAQTTQAKAQIVYYDVNGGIIRIDSTPALGYSVSWKSFSLSSHSPANAVKMDLRLTTEDATGAVVLFDGIRLKVPGLAGKYDFTGKRQDEGTGLTYFGARFYDPESCRFTTMDPARQGKNWFTYCFNNPLRLIDPTGMEASYNSYDSNTGASSHGGPIDGYCAGWSSTTSYSFSYSEDGFGGAYVSNFSVSNTTTNSHGTNSISISMSFDANGSVTSSSISVNGTITLTNSEAISFNTGKNAFSYISGYIASAITTLATKNVAWGKWADRTVGLIVALVINQISPTFQEGGRLSYSAAFSLTENDNSSLASALASAFGIGHLTAHVGYHYEKGDYEKSGHLSYNYYI